MKNFYIASYGKDLDKGIYIINLNEETLEMKLTEHIKISDYPSYLICSDSSLYVSYKNANALNNGGGIGSFTIYNDQLILNNNYNSSGRSYTHLCIDDNHKYLFAANYHAGATASYKLKDRCIKEKICAVRHSGSGPDLLKRQTTPHVHNVGITPDKKFVYAVDLGADKVVMYNYKNGILNEAEDYTLNVIPGSGPRHMIFSKDGRFAYLVNEISNTIMVFKYVDSRLRLIQSVSTIPRHFEGFTSASAIRLTNSGNHIFVSNRGHDSIAMYRVNKETGKISLLTMIHTGKEPRDFNIYNDKYIIVASQGDNKIQLISLNEKEEKLTLLDNELSIPAPVCVAYE
jgi:6-phosphogluconolactonase